MDLPIVLAAQMNIENSLNNRMKTYEHGGDVYAENRKILDFSVNINPLGMPQSAAEAAQKAVCEELSYPDPFCRKLTAALSERYGLPSENIVCGNGASDIILRLCAAVNPKRVFVPAPGFSEYARSAELFDAEVFEYPVPGFKYSSSFAENLGWAHLRHRFAQGNNIVFVCRPNNPDGSMISLDELRLLAEQCAEADSLLVVDECFLEFTDATSALALLDRCKSVLVINAFTKTYAMAGLRMGFAFSADTKLLDNIYRFGTPWSVSSAAQAAGIACCGEIGFLAGSRRYIAEERKRLISAIETLGLKVFPSDANFLLIKDDRAFDERTKRDLYHLSASPKHSEIKAGDQSAAYGDAEKRLYDINLSSEDSGRRKDGCNRAIEPGIAPLREALYSRGIKVRDCRSFSSLDDSYIRIGVRTKEENDVFIDALKQVINEGFVKHVL